MSSSFGLCSSDFHHHCHTSPWPSSVVESTTYVVVGVVKGTVSPMAIYDDEVVVI